MTLRENKAGGSENSMRVGVMTHTLNSVDGGFHYEVVFLDALSEFAARFPEELVYLTSPQHNLAALAAMGGLAYRGLPISPLPQAAAPLQPPDAYLKSKPAQHPKLALDAFQCDRRAAMAFRHAGVDLILMLGPYGPAFTWVTPFVMSVYDLNHRLQPEFPEVSAFGEFDRREYLYTNVCRYATFVIVDSDVGKEDLLRFYGHLIDEDRVRILPYHSPVVRQPQPRPDDLARVAAKHRLPKRYFFYPAQFWRHKNHALILQAQRIVADQAGEKIPVVFCGSYADYARALNFKEVWSLAAGLGLANDVRYLGPVPDEDMPALYTLSAGLVMPTFFGPTNIPPLEAWHFGRPVITSDIRGLREQMGDAALLVDPRSPQALADAMLRLWRDDALAAELAERGRTRLASRGWSSFVDGVAAILTEACERVRAGRTPRFPNVNLA
jgi:glycosyltransferase involved in cell wall biosynthesis